MTISSFRTGTRLLPPPAPSSCSSCRCGRRRCGGRRCGRRRCGRRCGGRIALVESWPSSSRLPPSSRFGRLAVQPDTHTLSHTHTHTHTLTHTHSLTVLDRNRMERTSTTMCPVLTWKVHKLNSVSPCLFSSGFLFIILFFVAKEGATSMV